MGRAIELEYISPQMKSDLEAQFEKAQFSSKDLAAIKQKQWTCDMYGVRSRLQVKRGIKLYKWMPSKNLQNDGAQIVRDYRESTDGVVGTTDRFEDQVKINSKGQLLSKLSLIAPERQVVAYSVCESI